MTADYFRKTQPLVVAADCFRLILAVVLPLGMTLAFKNLLLHLDAPVHRHVFSEAGPVAALYVGALVVGFGLLGCWFGTSLRNFVAIGLYRTKRTLATRKVEESLMLPPHPFKPESFALVLAEVQDRTGERVPNDNYPNLTPSWLVIPS